MLSMAVALFGAGLAAVAPAMAQDKMAAVEARQAVMKSNGASAGKIAGYLKGQGTAADVAAAAGTIADNAKKLATLFPAGTSSTDLPGKTRAKPELFANMSKASGYIITLGERATALQTAANGGNKEAIQAAFGAMSKDACGACHTEFRGPELK